ARRGAARAAGARARRGVGDRDTRGGSRNRPRGGGRPAERAQRGERAPLMRAVVVALGKIGLPLAVQINNAGHEVVGCDINEDVVALVSAGKVPFPNEPGIAQALPIEATTDTAAAVVSADLVVLVPPLLVGDD